MLLLNLDYVKDTRFQSYVDFEDSVCKVLESALSQKETIKRRVLLDNRTRLVADIVLSEGCARLNIKPNTLIECVTAFRFDTVKRVVFHLNRAKVFEHYTVLIIYLESSIPEKEILITNGVRVISFNELQGLIPREGPITILPKGWKEERKCRIIDAQNDFLCGKVTLFLGAGVSASANLPSWKELLKRLIAELNKKGKRIDFSKVSKDADNSNLIVGRALREAFGSTHSFEQAVRDALYQTPSSPKALVNTLSDIIYRKDNIEKVITYNFDDVLEQAMIKDYCSITEENRIDPGLFPIYHVHGFLPESPLENPSKIVFSEEAYHDVYKLAYHWSNLEQLHSLANTSCFFIGLSMKDPNVRRLLDIASERDKDVYHYAFLRRPEFIDPDVFERLLMELHVKVIWYRKFDQLPGLLDKEFV